MIAFDEIQKDAITEILNVAIGHAASSLNEMVEEEVSLSVPSLDIISRVDAIQRLSGGEDTVAVKQRFKGPFWGEVMLIFPERKSLDLVRTITRDTVPLDSLTELEQEALMEVGNIILNACLGSIANQLGRSLESSLPLYLRGHGAGLFGDGPGAGDLVLFLHVDFALRQQQIYGYVAFILEIASALSFREVVDDYLGTLGC